MIYALEVIGGVILFVVLTAISAGIFFSVSEAIRERLKSWIEEHL